MRLLGTQAEEPSFLANVDVPGEGSGLGKLLVIGVVGFGLFKLFSSSDGELDGY
jgi:hypothetical protein